MTFHIKSLVTGIAIVASTFCFQNSADAQGFRIGRIMQAGGGQGFRLGGPRGGMHFGGGQGASIGAGNIGMRFGNGQGTRIGGQNYGMQFGGRQGTQIGRFATTPSVAPGTYYYNDVRGYQYPQAIPMVQSPIMMPGQMAVPQPTIYPAYPGNTIPQPLNVQTAYPSTPMVTTPSSIEPTTATPSSAPILATEIEVADSGTSLETAADTNQATGGIRLSHSAEATESIKFNLSGTDHTLAPGKSMSLDTDTDWKVLFSAGEAFGDRAATLSNAGDFEFTMSADEGWVLMEMETIPETAEATPDQTLTVMEKEAEPSQENIKANTEADTEAESSLVPPVELTPTTETLETPTEEAPTLVPTLETPTEKPAETTPASSETVLELGEGTAPEIK